MNRVVNEFNENSAQIKENAQGIKELTTKNKELLEASGLIQEKIKKTMDLAKAIDERLDEISLKIDQLFDEFSDKHRMIDQCDDTYDALIDLIEVQAALIPAEIEESEDSELKRLIDDL